MFAIVILACPAMSRADGWDVVGPPSGVVHSFAFNSQRTTLYAATDSGLMKFDAATGWHIFKRNECIDWPLGDECITYLRIYSHPLRSDVWLVGWQDEWFGIQTYFSRMTDPEGTWQEVRGYAQNQTFFNVTFNTFNPAIIYGTLDAYSRSDDTGRTWSYPAGANAFRWSRFIASDVRRLATLYTFGSPSPTAFYGVYKSTDNGSHWTLAYRDSFGYELSYTSGLATGDTIVIGMSTSTLSTESGILYSPDGGASWRKTLRGVSVTALARNPGRPQYVYAGTPDGIYISGNGGFTWERWNTTLPRVPISQLATDPYSDTIYAATNGAGILRVYGYSTDVRAVTDALPDAYDVMPPFPNPFNPATTIEIVLPQSEAVVVDVFNVLGQRVAVLAERILSAGRHSLRFDAGTHPGGLYIIRSRLGGRYILKSVLLIR